MLGILEKTQETSTTAWRARSLDDSPDAGSCPCISKSVSSKTARQHFGSELEIPCSQGHFSLPTKFSHICAPMSIRNEPTMEKQSQDGAPSPAQPWCLLHHIWLAIIAEAHVAYAGANHHTNNTAELSGIVEPLLFLSSIGLVPRGSQVFSRFETWCQRLLWDGAIAVECPLRLTSKQLFLQVQLRTRVTLRHTYSHGGNVGNVCGSRGRSWCDGSRL